MRFHEATLRRDHFAAAFNPARLGAIVGVALDPWQHEVMNFDSARLLLNCHRQSGKSTVVALKALWTGLFQNGLVLLLSPSLRQSRELFKKVTAFYELLGCPVHPKVHNSLELELSTGGRIVSLPSSEATIRGFSGPTLIIMDEASRIPSVLFDAIIPMQTVSGGTLVLLSTPWGKRGFFYEAWAGMKGNWHQLERLATDCPRITPHRLAEARDLMDEPKFNREYLCKFTETPGQYFSEQSLERAFRIGNRDTESGDPYGSLSSLFSDPLQSRRDSFSQSSFFSDPSRPGDDSSIVYSDLRTSSQDRPGARRDNLSGQYSNEPERHRLTDEELAAQALLELGGDL
ncbi:MAG TPA: terminase family protein [Blastocatellia bacterium]